jgi:exosortase/archaeosortase family protein
MTATISAPTRISERGVHQSSLAWLAIAVVAAPSTIVGLLRGLNGELPAAYAGVAAVAMVAVALFARPTSPPRSPQWSIALFATAMSLAGLAPFVPSGRFDVLSVFAVAVAIAVTRGAARAVGWITALGVLSWPVVHTELIGRHLRGFTSGTVIAVEQFDRLTNLASRQGSSSSFAVVHNGATSVLDVAVSCSGANGLAATLIVGIIVSSLSSASLRRKALWLLLGLIAQWVFNVARIIVLFWVAQRWGTPVAIDTVHPVIGLALFVGVLAGMWRLARRMGIVPLQPSSRIAPPTVDAADPTMRVDKFEANPANPAAVTRLAPDIASAAIANNRPASRWTTLLSVVGPFAMGAIAVCAMVNVAQWSRWSQPFDPMPVESSQTPTR